MKREDDQQLWDLLAQAAPRQLSPFFARNVVRRIRERSDRFEWLRRWISPRTLVPATGVAIAVIATILAVPRPAGRNPADSLPDVIVKIDPQDYDVVADLDELLATDESNLWDDDTQTL
ncbi:MAG TPA: hypothetical protein VN827_10160 [Chthoniobacterales bacterium]|nr:hypothetical protein [Chthoniobacterales bacterium]